jgi:hypothetical protein
MAGTGGLLHPPERLEGVARKSCFRISIGVKRAQLELCIGVIVSFPCGLFEQGYSLLHVPVKPELTMQEKCS